MLWNTSANYVAPESDEDEQLEEDINAFLYKETDLCEYMYIDLSN